MREVWGAGSGPREFKIASPAAGGTTLSGPLGAGLVMEQGQFDTTGESQGDFP